MQFIREGVIATLQAPVQTVQELTKSVSKETDGNVGGSKFHITASKDDDASTKMVDIFSEQLLIAAGRIPNSDTLDLHKTGVSVNDRGYIVTYKYLETKVKQFMYPTNEAPDLINLF